MAPMIEQERWGDVVSWRFAHGKVSALDLEFLVALDQALAAAEKDAIRALVWTGTGNAFSAGVDLHRIVQGGAAYVERFVPLLSRVLRRCFAFPKPVVAAVNGHAIAGGCILTCAADLRFMAAGNGRIGVPELRVGVPFPAIALEIVRFATGGRGVQDIVYTGANYTPDDAQRRGLVDEVVEPGTLIERARAAAVSLAALPPAAFAAAKRDLRAPALERADRSERENGAAVLAEWARPETQAGIREYLERTLRK
jgi:enoyl-CoA hydratase